MRINSTTNACKSHRGRITGYQSYYRSLGTYPERPTKPESEAKLAEMVKFRCDRESARVQVVTILGHVGVFSYSLEGYIDTRHVWPDGSTSLSSGSKSIQDAEDSFRHHVAQITWNGTLDIPAFLPESLHGEFHSWVEFQLRYRIARKSGMSDVNAHQWACDNRNPYEELTA